MVIDRNIVKNMLINYRFYIRNIETLDKQIELLEEELDGLKGCDYSKDRVQCEPKNLLEEKAVKIADMKLKRDFEKLRVQAIENAINELDDIDRMIMQLKYMDKNSLFVTWVSVARTVGYSKEQCQNRRNEALGKISIVVDGII